MSIKNIVATAKLCTELRLSVVADALLANPRLTCFGAKPGRGIIDLQLASGKILCWVNSPFGSINIKGDKNTLFQIFQSGRVISVGGTTEGQAKRNFLRYIRLITDLGISAAYEDYQIRNIVATYDHKSPLSLLDIARRYKLELEPEFFPAVRYRIGELGVTVNIFHTGKCTILGAKSVEIVSKAAYKIKDLLEECKK